MQITKSHLKVLQNFIKINPALFYDGNFTVSVRSVDKILRAEVDLLDFIDIPFAFYDMGVILPFMKEGSELEITDNQIRIKDDDSTFKYRLSSMDRIQKEAGNPTSFASFNLTTTDIKFNLIGSKFKNFMSYCGKMNCDSVDIYSRDSNTFVIKGYIRNAKKTSSFELVVEKEHEHISDLFTFDITKFQFIDSNDMLFEIGTKQNNNGNSIPVMKVKAILSDIEVKYILAAQSKREKENTDE